MLTTEIGYTTRDRITVRGRDVAGELIGRVDFTDMILLTAIGRTCSPGEREMVNAILVTVTDHGLTPSALAARLTFTGAPEAPQAAVAAGLVGVGSVFVGAMSESAAMLSEAADGLDEDAADGEIRDCARALVRQRRAERRHLPGFGHNIHSGGDPRIPALREVSARNGYDGFWWKLVTAVDEVSGEHGRHLPVNAAGGIAAMTLSMGLPFSMARGLALIGRCAGLVAHIAEEEQAPIGRDLWDLVLAQDGRNVLE